MELIDIFFNDCIDKVIIPRPRRKSNGWYRKRMDKERYKKLYSLSSNTFAPSGVYYKENNNGDTFFKRFYRGKRSKYLKKQSNKKIRRYGGEISGGGEYKKLYDYWWELY